MITLLLLISLLVPRVGAEDPAPRGPRAAQGAREGKAARAGRAGRDGKSPKPARTPGMMFAGAALQQGSVQTAIRMYSAQVKKNPEAPAPNVALGRALARGGRCTDALDSLWPWMDTTPFGHRAALAASSCSARLGLWADAIFFDYRALEEKPGDVQALSALALDLERAGDSLSSEDVLDVLAMRSKGDASHYARAVLAVRRGDVDAFDAVLHTMEREGRNVKVLRRMDAQLWMDLGDPSTAANLVSTGRSDASSKVLRAEALRRMGMPTGATDALRPTPRNAATGLTADAVRARVAVDLGEPEEAEALLQNWEGADDPEYYASRWYLARSRGDEAAMAEAAAAYALTQESPLRTLELLLPWEG